MAKTISYSQDYISTATHFKFMKLFNELRGENYCAKLAEIHFFEDRDRDGFVEGAVTREVVEGVGITSQIVTEFIIHYVVKTTITPRFFRADKEDISGYYYLEENTNNVYANDLNSREFTLV